MEEDLMQTKYKFKVPFNNEILALERRKAQKKCGILMIVIAVMMTTLAIICATAADILIGAIIFAALGVLFIGVAIYCFCTINPSSKDDNKYFEYFFYEDGLMIQLVKDLETGKIKKLENCLYRRFKNKQYVASITEYENKIEFKIYTGTNNGVPQFNYRSIPKSVISSEELADFTNFLKQKVGEDYLVKNK